MGTFENKLNTLATTIVNKSGGSGKKTLDQLNTIVSDDLVKPSGTLSVTSNGTVDVTNYASASVNIDSGVAECLFSQSYYYFSTSSASKYSFTFNFSGSEETLSYYIYKRYSNNIYKKVDGSEKIYIYNGTSNILVGTFTGQYKIKWESGYKTGISTGSSSSYYYVPIFLLEDGERIPLVCLAYPTSITLSGVTKGYTGSSSSTSYVYYSSSSTTTSVSLPSGNCKKITWKTFGAVLQLQGYSSYTYITISNSVNGAGTLFSE